jgi:hypothetical protein
MLSPHFGSGRLVRLRLIESENNAAEVSID